MWLGTAVVPEVYNLGTCSAGRAVNTAGRDHLIQEVSLLEITLTAVILVLYDGARIFSVCVCVFFFLSFSFFKSVIVKN